MIQQAKPVVLALLSVSNAHRHHLELLLVKYAIHHIHSPAQALVINALVIVMHALEPTVKCVIKDISYLQVVQEHRPVHNAGQIVIFANPAAYAMHVHSVIFLCKPQQHLRQ